MASEQFSSPDQNDSRPARRFPAFLRPGLTAIALIGVTSWAFALWIGPWLMPAAGPQEAPAAAATMMETAAPAVETAASEMDANIVEASLSTAPSKEDLRAEPRIVTRVVSIRPGDTLMEVLTRADIEAAEAHAAIVALREVFNPRKLMAGTELALSFETKPDKTKHGADDTAAFRKLAFSPSFRETVGVARAEDAGFQPFSEKTRLTHEKTRAAGTINSSLYVDATRAGVPAAVVVELIRAMSFDVDFQREIQQGDGFELLFDRVKDTGGNIVATGDLLYAKLTLSGKDIPIYRFDLDDGTFDYFNAKGESTRKTLMRTPVDGARLSSRFGKRHHPILGYNTMHKGLDFAAPPGTPIMAAGRGIVVSAGWNGGYGRYIRIRHNATYSTAYAHLKGFAKGIRRGARVSQGQIIGYVGTTGRSTGPHLHYEVLQNDRQVNPQSLKLPTGKTLKGEERTAFMEVREDVDRLLESTPLLVAQEASLSRKSRDKTKNAKDEARDEEPLGIGGP